MNVYEDVYHKGGIVGECPIFDFTGEEAIDEGGVQRDMYSAFWEQAYKQLFEGVTVLIPMIHPCFQFLVVTYTLQPYKCD